MNNKICAALTLSIVAAYSFWIVRPANSQEKASKLKIQQKAAAEQQQQLKQVQAPALDGSDKNTASFNVKNNVNNKVRYRPGGQQARPAAPQGQIHAPVVAGSQWNGSNQKQNKKPRK